MFGVIVYRIAIAVVLYASEEEIVRQRASLIASGTAACINLVVIVILNFVSMNVLCNYACILLYIFQSVLNVRHSVKERPCDKGVY